MLINDGAWFLARTRPLYVHANYKQRQKLRPVLEEEAYKEKLSFGRDLLLQILQENHSHYNAVKELDKKLREENSTHDDAVKELKEKIAELQIQIESSSEVENISTDTPSEPVRAR
jgi:predicted nuclease with TOPRIM domain